MRIHLKALFRQLLFILILLSVLFALALGRFARLLASVSLRHLPALLQQLLHTSAEFLRFDIRYDRMIEYTAGP